MGKYTGIDCGTLKIIPESDRSTTYDALEATVDDTWREIDLSAVVPQGTKALLAHLTITSADAQDVMILRVRSGDTTEDNLHATRSIALAAEIGATGGIDLQIDQIIRATNGIFDFRRVSSGYPIDSLYVRLRGYYI